MRKFFFKEATWDLHFTLNGQALQRLNYFENKQSKSTFSIIWHFWNVSLLILACPSVFHARNKEEHSGKVYFPWTCLGENNRSVCCLIWSKQNGRTKRKRDESIRSSKNNELGIKRRRSQDRLSCQWCLREKKGGARRIRHATNSNMPIPKQSTHFSFMGAHNF